MNLNIKFPDQVNESALSMLIIVIGIAMVAMLGYFVYLPFSEMIADQIQMQNSNIYYTSI